MAPDIDDSFQGRFMQFYGSCSEPEQAFLAWLFTPELEGDHAAESQAAADDVSGFAAGLGETQMSFNLQYLQLQSQMQHENRSYTAVSNIMQSKKRAVDSSLGLIR